MVSTSAPSTRRVALITGCSEPGSLGATLARELLGRGFVVYATARKVATMAQLGADGCELDVADEDSIRDAVAHVTKAEGRLDMLVNNAGVASQEPVLELDPAAFRQMLEINVIGPLRLVQAFTPLLLRTANPKPAADASDASALAKAKASEGQVVVVNIGSTAAAGMPWHAAYSASKAAFNSLSETMEREISGMGIKVITVILSGTRTAMTSRSKPFSARQDPSPGYVPFYDSLLMAVHDTFDKRVAPGQSRPEDVARAIAAAAVKRSPPATLWVGGGAALMRWLPALPRWVGEMLWGLFGQLKLVRRPTGEELGRMGA